MREYSRRLPHWNVTGRPLFATFRLADSLPTGRVFPPERLITGQAFVAMERLLDHAVTGPLFLRIPEIAEALIQALDQGQKLERYTLHSFVIMPNHVHLLVTPHVDVRRWLGPLKGFTANRANQILHRKVDLWQDESYDHLVRDSGEFERIRRYIEGNPVKAGLATTPETFPWSSAH